MNPTLTFARPLVVLLGMSPFVWACRSITTDAYGIDASRELEATPLDASSVDSTVAVAPDAGAADARSGDAAARDAASDAATDATGDAGTGDANTGAKPDAAAGPAVFTADNGTLARFEFNGDVLDSSGNARNATSLGTSVFAPTKFGSGLTLTADPQGFDWSAYASTVPATFTVEVVYTSSNSAGYRKIFGFSDSNDNGWYQYGTQFKSYPTAALGALPAGKIHYIALVSTSATMMDAWIDGALAGTTSIGFTAPPAQAIFFRDDSSTSRTERMDGVVDAARISSVARTPAEIAAVWAIVNQ